MISNNAQIVSRCLGSRNKPRSKISKLNQLKLNKKLKWLIRLLIGQLRFNLIIKSQLSFTLKLTPNLSQSFLVSSGRQLENLARLMNEVILLTNSAINLIVALTVAVKPCASNIATLKFHHIKVEQKQMVTIARILFVKGNTMRPSSNINSFFSLQYICSH